MHRSVTFVLLMQVRLMKNQLRKRSLHNLEKKKTSTLRESNYSQTLLPHFFISLPVSWYVVSIYTETVAMGERPLPGPRQFYRKKSRSTSVLAYDV